MCLILAQHISYVVPVENVMEIVHKVIMGLNYTLIFKWNSQKEPSTSATNAIAVSGCQSILSRETWVGKLTAVYSTIFNWYAVNPIKYA